MSTMVDTIYAIGNELRVIGNTLRQARSHDYTKPLVGNIGSLTQNIGSPTQNIGSLIPIIMVHGSSGNQLEWAGAWEKILSTFANHPCYAFSLDVPFDSETETQSTDKGYFGLKRLAYTLDRSIDEYAAELDSRVEYVRQKHGGKQVILFGHSMGGLIACAYRKRDYVAAIVTFCSPLRGTPHLTKWPIRAFLTTRRHREMTPGSTFLDRIRETFKEEQNKQKIFSVGSINDFQVPAEYSYFPDSDHLIVSTSGHLSITDDIMVLNAVKQFLDRFQ